MRFAFYPLLMLLASGCSVPQVEGSVMKTCGPSDGFAFVVIIPDGNGTVLASGPGWPGPKSAPYLIDPRDRLQSVSIRSCATDLANCENAVSGSFAIVRGDDGIYSGTLQAVFPEAGSRRLIFTATKRERSLANCD